MNYFIIDLAKLNDAITQYNDAKKNINDNISDIYETLKNTDSGWYDNKSIDFIEKLKKDKYNILNYFDGFDKLYEKINIFKEKLNNFCNKYGYKNDLVKIKYNEQNIVNCINKLNNVLNYLSRAQYYINLCNFDNDFEAISKVRQLRDSLKKIKVEINQLINNLLSAKRDINNLINYSRDDIIKENFDLDVDLIEYGWKIIDLDIKNI